MPFAVYFIKLRTFSRVLTDYSRSMLHERLSALVLLAFEKDIISQTKFRRLPLF